MGSTHWSEGAVNKQTTRGKQAILVIHGMGEQRPMDTLRSFVDAAILGPRHNSKHQKYFSKPDPISESMEVRKLSDSRTDKPADTDFYEYYWAYQVGPGKWSAVLTWMAGFLLQPWRLSKRLLLPYMILVVLIVAVLWVILGLLPQVGSWIQDLTMASNLGFSDLLTVGGIAISILFFPVTYFFLYYLGDAEKYLRAKPANIAFRQRIRRDGLKLLRDMHKEKYERIIVVSHSLGSVIAYDLIKHLWIEFNNKQREEEYFGKDKVKKLWASRKCITALQDAQESIWEEQKKRARANKTVPWLISDFITLGSPLAHGTFLLANSREEFKTRKKDRELPTCPPEEDPCGKYGYFYDNSGFLVPHHAAPFVCVRWTNIYYPGDFIGGPLGAVFGKGIKDIRASSKSLFDWSVFSHTRYWKPSSNDKSPIAKVRKIIGLN